MSGYDDDDTTVGRLHEIAQGSTRVASAVIEHAKAVATINTSEVAAGLLAISKAIALHAQAVTDAGLKHQRAVMTLAEAIKSATRTEPPRGAG